LAEKDMLGSIDFLEEILIKRSFFVANHGVLSLFVTCEAEDLVKIKTENQ